MGENGSLMSDGLSRRDRKRIESALQKVALVDYPNPERKGCRSDKAALRDLAARRLRPTDPLVQHVSECSPCFTEAVQLRRDFDRSFRRRIFVVLTILAFTAVCLRRKAQ